MPKYNWENQALKNCFKSFIWVRIGAGANVKGYVWALKQILINCLNKLASVLKTTRAKIEIKAIAEGKFVLYNQVYYHYLSV